MKGKCPKCGTAERHIEFVKTLSWLMDNDWREILEKSNCNCINCGWEGKGKECLIWPAEYHEITISTENHLSDWKTTLNWCDNECCQIRRSFSSKTISLSKKEAEKLHIALSRFLRI